MTDCVVLELAPSRANPRNSEGAFVDLDDGTILFAYTHFYGGGDDASAARIAVRRSVDGGRTWSSADELLVENTAGSNVMSVSFLRLASGDILLFYLFKNNQHDCRPMLCRSTDEGSTWSDPVPVIRVPGYFVLNNDRVVQLDSGRLVLPVAFHRNCGAAPGAERHDTRGILMWYLSDDDGATWREAETWWASSRHNRAGLQEPGVIQLMDGTLFSWARTHLGYQYACRSGDDGVTWSAPERTRFRSPCSPLSMKRISATGQLLAVWNDHSGALLPAPASIDVQARTPLVAAVSPDEGVTWFDGKLLEDSPDHGFCYTAIHFVEDAVLLAYCAGRSDTGILNSLRLKRVPLDWLNA